MSEAIKGLVEGLSIEQTSRLLDAVTTITTEAYKRYGIVPTLDEVAALGQVKAMTLEGVEGDVSNALFQLSKETPSVVAHIAAASAANVAPVGPASQGGVLTVEDIAALPPYVQQYVHVGMSPEDIAGLNPSIRMTIARAVDLKASDRNPSALNGGQDREMQTYTDTLPLDALTPAERLTRARRQG
jgi:hypothetical protein